MSKINLRNAITRTITYTEVIADYNGKTHIYNVYGVTTAQKELKKILRTYKGEDIPTVEVETKTERRVITLDKFLENSILLNILNNESEEN